MGIREGLETPNVKKPKWIRGQALQTVLGLNALQPGDELLYREDRKCPIEMRKLRSVGCGLGDNCLGTDVNGNHTFRSQIVAWRRPLK